jgi:hypothetical protein
MSKDESPAPRGEAAWKAAKASVAKRNEVAYERGRKERAARDAAMRTRQAAADRRESAQLPKQPKRPRQTPSQPRPADTA